MALPAHASTGLLPSESESLALQTQRILILPTRALDKVRLMQGTFGPFRPARTCSVPLWLALHLKRKRKARIVCPDWLSVDSLKSSLRHETTSDSFCSLPLHYPSIARALIDDASDDIPDASLVRSLLKDLREARQAKIMQGLSDVNCWHLEMSNISHSELCELRPFINRAFDDLKRLLPSSSRAGADELYGPGMGYAAAAAAAPMRGSFAPDDSNYDSAYDALRHGAGRYATSSTSTSERAPARRGSQAQQQTSQWGARARSQSRSSSSSSSSESRRWERRRQQEEEERGAGVDWRERMRAQANADADADADGQGRAGSASGSGSGGGRGGYGHTEDEGMDGAAAAREQESMRGTDMDLF